MVIGVGMPASAITTSMAADTTKSIIVGTMDTAHDMDGIIMDAGVTDMPVITIITDRRTSVMGTLVPAWLSSTRPNPVIIDMTTDQTNETMSSGILFMFRIVALKKFREEMAGM